MWHQMRGSGDTLQPDNHGGTIPSNIERRGNGYNGLATGDVSSNSEGSGDGYNSPGTADAPSNSASIGSGSNSSGTRFSKSSTERQSMLTMRKERLLQEARRYVDGLCPSLYQRDYIRSGCIICRHLWKAYEQKVEFMTLQLYEYMLYWRMSDIHS